MRGLITLAGVSFLCLTGADCCGVGGPELTASYGVDECAYFGCPLAIGSEVDVHAFTYSVEPDAIVDASLNNPFLADVAVASDRVVLRPHIEGTGIVSVTLADETLVQAYVETAHVASTTVVFDPFVEQLRPSYPGGRMQMFVGSRLRVIAKHSDQRGRALLGHGVEQWSISGGMLADPSPDMVVDDLVYPYFNALRDMALVRDVVATGEPVIAITAAEASVPVEIDVVPAGSTARLRIDTRSLYVSADNLSIGTAASFYVGAFSADGRYIHGAPAGGELAATVVDPAIATVTIDSYTRALRITGTQPGTTDVIVSFDGLEVRFPITVRAPAA
jgi:hypothetical protein